MVDAQGITHHVKINDDHFIVKPGTYRKMPAQVFGPRFTTGDPDWNNLSFWQHWAQRCWIGGFDAPLWEDDAMFDKSIGVDTTNHEVLLLARDMGGPLGNRQLHNFDLSEEAGTLHQREFFSWKGSGDREKLYAFSLHSGPSGTNDARLFRYTGSDWVQVVNFARDCQSVSRFRGGVIFGTSGTVLRRMTGAPGSESFADVAKPSGVTDVPHAMRPWREQLWVGFGASIWRLNRDLTWDGSTAFYDASDVKYFTGFELHLGFLYMSSDNGHILRSDGNNTFDMWSMEPGTEITSLRSFDGRLFIACRDPLEGTDAAEAVLYQFSGAAVTELKRMGAIGTESSFGKLRTLGGRLMMGAASLWGFAPGFGVTMYDPIEDSYHMFCNVRNNTTYPPGTENRKWIVDDTIWFNNYLWASVRGYGIFRTPYSVRDVERYLATYSNDTAGGTAPNGGWLESSEFDAGTPGMLKLFNAFVVDVDLPSAATTVGLDYSIDGGLTWVTVGTITKTGAATRYVSTVPIGPIATGGVYASSFKYRIRLFTTDNTRTPAVRGMIVRYLPIPDPNWVWVMDLVLSDTQILLDETVQQPDNVEKLANLEAAFRAQNLIRFVDIDGTQWADDGTSPGALIQRMESVVTNITPFPEETLERDVRIQIIEAVEAYES